MNYGNQISEQPKLIKTQALHFINRPDETTKEEIGIEC